MADKIYFVITELYRYSRLTFPESFPENHYEINIFSDHTPPPPPGINTPLTSAHLTSAARWLARSPVSRARLASNLVELHQTLDGSFSALWTATIARVGAFFGIFRDLQDYHSFAPLRSQNCSKKSSNFLKDV